MEKLDLLYFHTASPKYIRVKKISNSLSLRGIRYVFFGAERIGSPWKSSSNNLKSRFVFSHGLSSVFAYLFYIVEAIILLKKLNPKSIIITNEELIFIPLIAGFKGRIILDAIDSLSIRSTSSFFIINYLFKKITHICRKRSDVIVEVEEFRKSEFPDYLHKTLVLQNSINLESSDLENVEYYKEKYNDFIFCWGSLNNDINGLEKLVEVINKLDGKIYLVIAGIIKDVELQVVVDNCVYASYLGVIDHFECLSLLSASNAGFAFYKPINENFVLAAPNKVYEAQACKKQLIINSEVKISKYAVSKGFGISCGYEDVDSLYNIIIGLLDKNTSKSNIDSAPSWESQFNDIPWVIS